MGYITLGIVAFTLISVVFGGLLGLMRGRNRAILRLCLILASIGIAIYFRETVVQYVMNFNIDGGTIRDMLSEMLNDIGTDLPEAIKTLIFTLVEILIGLVAFFIVFFVLSLLSWMIVFPVCKIFIRKGKKRRTLVGGLVGLIQGVVVAFVICAPLTGMIVQVDKVSQVKLEGERLFEIPSEIGTTEYLESTPGVIYNTTGGWLFNLVTSTKDENGKKVSIDDTCDIVVTVAGIADTVTQLTDKVESMTSGTATPQEQIDAIKSVGDSLVEIGNSIENLSTDAKTIVNDLVDSVKEMVSSEGGEIPPEVEEFLDDFDVNNLKLASAGKAMNGIATYIEKTSEEFDNNEPVTQEDVDNIVNGLADNSFIVNLIVGDGNEAPQIIELDAENESKFTTAINNTSLSEDDKNTLRQLFGLTTN